MLFSEICNLIVLGAVHPASDGEYEKVQRVRHVLTTYRSVRSS